MAAYRSLVTGATGFAGSHLVQELLGHGWVVAGTGLRESFIELQNYSQCDLTHSVEVCRVIEETAPNVIFHLASLTPSAARSSAPDVFYAVNLLGTLNLLEAVRQYAPDALVVLVTSSAMYGKSTASDGVITEDDPLMPINAYGVSKAAQHLLGYQYAMQYSLKIIRVCPFNLIGPGLQKGLVASDFAYQLAAIETGLQDPVIHVGNLNSFRDFLDVRDAARAYVALAQQGTPGVAYNLASNTAIPIQRILDTLIELSGSKVTVLHDAALAQSKEVSIQIGRYDRLADATGWMPRIPLETTLKDVLDYWRMQLKAETKLQRD
jgi:GDP-4-dehydro-6-deoxy-D-mannose reductase